MTKIALAQTFERAMANDGNPIVPPTTPWPQVAAYVVPAEAEALPVPGAYNFKYSRVFQLGGAITKSTSSAANRSTDKDKPKVTAKRPRAPMQIQPFGGLFGSWPTAASNPATN